MFRNLSKEDITATLYNNAWEPSYKDNIIQNVNITVKGKSRIVDIIENKNIVIVRKLVIKEHSSLLLNINIRNRGRVVIYDEVLLEKGSIIRYNLSGQMNNDLYHYIKVIHSENSKSHIDIRAVVPKTFVSIGVLEHPLGSRRSQGTPMQLVITRPNSKTILLPSIKVLDPGARASHGAKKIILTQEQEFYLRSKGLSPKTILNLLEESIKYDTNLRDFTN